MINTFTIVWKNIKQQLGAATLSILLTAFGVSILLVIAITGESFEKQIENNSKNIDLVVGAKGSPMQLILSSLYHVDNPTGNIPLAEANTIAENPLVDIATPISLGDNYKGHRIIGTDASFLELYELKITKGNIWKKSFEVVVGAEVANKQNLKIGDQIHSAHGLSPEAHVHDDHPFTVVGILSFSNSVVDNLILTSLSSVWDVHGISHEDEHLHNDSHNHEAHMHNHEEHHHHDESNDDHIDEFVKEKPTSTEGFVKNIGQELLQDQGVEITALLIKYRSPAAISVIPRIVNQNTQMQAASPALESSRIFSLLGVGLDSLTVLAYVVMMIAALSVFISLYNALKARKYDMAIMRTLGATKNKLFTIIIVEGFIITLIGGVLGLLIGHFILYYISNQTSQSADFIEVFKFNIADIYVLIGAIILGIIAAIIPALKAYNTTISNTLSSK